MKKKEGFYYICERVKKGDKWTQKYLAVLGKLSKEEAAEELEKWKMKMGLSKI